jgi:hypothetical protein
MIEQGLGDFDLGRLADSAYVDRADIVQYVGPPSRDAIYFILRSCVIELIRAGIIRPIVSFTVLASFSTCGSTQVHISTSCVCKRQILDMFGF